MSYTGRKGLVRLELEGAEHPIMLDWQELGVLATWGENDPQANITLSEIELTLSARKAVLAHIAGGTAGGVGIFEGLPCKLIVSNNMAQEAVFDGYLDLTDGFGDSAHIGRVSCSLRRKGGTDRLNEMLSGVTYGYIESLGVIGQADYEELYYVVEKQDNTMVLITSAITGYMMAVQGVEAANKAIDAINELAALFAAGFTGPLMVTIRAAGKAVINVAYVAGITYAVLALANKMFAALVPPSRTHKVCRLKTLLEKACKHLGFELETGIKELDTLYFLPSNNEADTWGADGFISVGAGTDSGIPNTADPGYLCSEMFRIVSDLFNACYCIEGGKVQFRSADDPYWLRAADWKMPDVLEKTKGYNTADLKANRIFQFATDPSDEWTVLNFGGTNYEVITDAIQVRNKDAKYIKGLEQINIPWALGTRKNEVGVVEGILVGLGELVNGLIGVLGSPTQDFFTLKNRIGALKVSNPNTNLPKMLKISGKKLDAGHRDTVRARYFVENYHGAKSFVKKWQGQKAIYEGVRIPFGFDDFLKVADNAYFRDSAGNECGITKLEYNISADTATVDYWVSEVYTHNLKETYIEA